MSKIVITGGSSDIGLAILNLIAKEGDEIIIQANQNTNKCEEFIDNSNINADINIEKADFTDMNSVNSFCQKIIGSDILINAAASTINAPLPHLTDDQIGSMISVNISAFIKVCQAVIPSMLPKRKGSIVNISSVVASRANKGQTVYAGTKGFVESFSKALAAEYGHKGIRVNCIAPGPINSGSLVNTLNFAEKEVKDSIISRRLGTAADVANAVRFLCLPESEYINGSVIKVDGGFMRGL